LAPLNSLRASNQTPNWNHLTYVYIISLPFLANNEIGHEGALALAELIKANRLITDLDICIDKTNNTLAENYIGDAGAEAIFNIAKTNDKFKLLCLCNYFE
jgi:hypothetical protein